MSKEDILSMILPLLPKLQQWMQYKNVALEAPEREQVKVLAGVLAPGRTFCFHCSPSVGELLTIIYSYYQRESQG